MTGKHDFIEMGKCPGPAYKQRKINMIQSYEQLNEAKKRLGQLASNIESLSESEVDEMATFEADIEEFEAFVKADAENEASY